LSQPQDNSSTDWYLGVDLGTGSCKCVVAGAQARILGFGQADYPAPTAQSRWDEQDPKSLLSGILQAAKAAVAQAGVAPERCRGISLGGAMHSLVALDGKDQPLTGVITWADGRGAPYAQEVRRGPDALRIYRQTGCPPHGMYPLYKLVWLRRERADLFARAARFASAKEVIFHRLTGAWAADPCIASGSGLLDQHTQQWSADALEIAGIHANQLSPLAGPRSVYPCADRDLAAALGISPQTSIVLGSTDAANSNLGAGAVQPWQATAMIGTSGAFRILATQPYLDEKARLWCYAVDEGRWLVGGAINNGGISLAWLKSALDSALPQGSPGVTFERLTELAEQAGAGAGGVLCLPFFAGERSPNWNLNAHAAFFGLTLQHDARHLARAVMEGVAFRLRSISAILTQEVGEIREVRASGGFTHSSLWPHIVASALQRDLLPPTWGETSGLGAAMWPMFAAGTLAYMDGVTPLVPTSARYTPDPHDAAIYDRLFPLYQEIYDRLAPAFDQVAEIQKELIK
jgi:gluconokinase